MAADRSDSRAAANSRFYGAIANSSASDSEVPNGSPGSRDHVCTSTTAPAASAGSIPDWIHALKSSEYAPEQSSGGSPLPPLDWTAVRRTGAATQREPPWNGTDAGPESP